VVVLDQLAHHLDRLGRREAVVVGDEGDLAAVDAAGGIDHVPIGRLGLADDAIGRERAAVGIGMAELDLLVGYAGIVFFLRTNDRRSECKRSRAGRKRAALHLGHPFPPVVFV
jgi:hypothetical protein